MGAGIAPERGALDTLLHEVVQGVVGNMVEFDSDRAPPSGWRAFYGQNRKGLGLGNRGTSYA